MAKHLAAKGFVVLAIDMRGYGKWITADPEKREYQGESVCYKQSYEDLTALVTAARAKYPGLPLYMIGESLGAGFVLHVASDRPELLDGMVLSSPAIKRRFAYPAPQWISDSMLLIANPKRQLNLVPYIRRFASEDPRIVDAAIK